MVLNRHGGEIKDKIEYDFSVNINPLGMPDYVKQAIAESIDSLCEYPDRLCTDLKKCIAEYEGVNDDRVLCGNGASELIMAICAFAANEKKAQSSTGNRAGIKALIQAPAFSGYERAVKSYGGEVTYYRNCDEAIAILESMHERIAYGCETKDIDMIFICNPNNPTGEAVKKQELINILDIAKKNNMLVVVDECFTDFTHEESIVDKNGYDNLVVLKAFTKFYALAGVRLGYICAVQELCEKIAKYLPEWNVSTIAQSAGLAALSDSERTVIWKQDTLELIDAERAYLSNELKKLGFWVSDSKANFLLCKSEDSDIFEKLRNVGILVRDCGNFNGLDSSYIRICVSTHEKNEKLINAIKEFI